MLKSLKSLKYFKQSTNSYYFQYYSCRQMGITPTLLLLLLLTTLSIPVPWQKSPDIISIPIYITSNPFCTGTGSCTFGQTSTIPYNKAFSSIPKIVIGRIKTTQEQLIFYDPAGYSTSHLQIASIAQTSCYIRAYFQSSTNGIVSVTDMNVTGAILVINSQIQGIQVISYTYQSGNLPPLTLASEANQIAITIISGIKYKPGSTNLSVNVSSYKPTSTPTSINIWISSPTYIEELYYQLIQIQPFKLSKHNIYFDTSSFDAQNSSSPSPLIPSNFNLNDNKTDSLIIGIRSLQAYNAVNINLHLNGTIFSTDHYNKTGVNVLNFRIPNCPTDYPFFTLDFKCKSCHELFPYCINCPNNQTCTQCPLDRYFNTLSCQPCKLTCVTCKSSADYCTSCSKQNLRQLFNNKCQCITPFLDCENSPSSCHISKCSYLQKPDIKVKKLIKNPTKNSLTFYLSISPVSTDFDSFKFQQLLTFKLPEGNSIVSYKYSSGIIEVVVDYSQNLQGYNASFGLNLSKVGLWYFSSAPENQISYQIQANNNLAINVYSDSIYKQHYYLSIVVKSIVCFGFVIYFIGLFSSQLISSEMFAVVQISYFGLFIVNKSDPLIQSLNNFGYSNGYNSIFNLQQLNSPDRIYAIGFTPMVIGNLNLSLILLIIPPILAFIFYRIHLRSTKWRIKMQKAWKRALGEFSITAMLLTLYNFSCSFGIFLFSKISSSWEFYTSIVEIILYFALIAVNVWLFITKSKIWIGQYRQFFNWNTFSQKYYLIPIGQRFAVGLLLSTASISFSSGIVSVLIFGTSIVIVAIKKPFIQKFHNVRSIVHSSISIFILVLYIVLSIKGPSKGESNFTYVPYIIVGGVFLNISFGFFCIVKHFMKKHQIKKHKYQQQKISEQQEALQMDFFNHTNKIAQENRIKAISNASRMFKVA